MFHLMFSMLEVTAKTSFSKISKCSTLVTTVYFSLWDNWGPDWGSDDEDDSYELSYDDSGSMLQSPFGRAIDMGNGEIPYCVNGQWNEDDQKCDCFPGFVESQDDDEV